MPDTLYEIKSVILGHAVADALGDFNYIALEILTNLEKLPHDFDIEYEKVLISDIEHIDAILYSGLRWGGIPTNKFW